VRNHLNNNNATTRTFFQTTNQNSLSGGFQLGINGGNSNGNNGFINLKENRSLLFSTFNVERMRILNSGSVGIGLANPITLLDVNGQVTVRTLPLDPTLIRVVVADSAGTLFYRDAADFEGSGGGIDDDWSGAATGQMFATNLNDRVSIGAASTTFKFEVVNDFINNSISTAGRFRTNATGKSGGKGILGLVFNGDGFKTGVEGRSINNDNSTTANNVGVRGSAESVGSANSNTGIRGEANGNASLNIGVQSIVDPNATVQLGIQSITRAGTSTVQNVGIRSIAQAGSLTGISIAENAAVRADGWHSPGVINNYGVRAFAVTSPVGVSGTPAVNYAIFASANGTDAITTVERAGFFQGDVEVTGAFINPSDRKLKENIKSYKGALDILNRLAPKTYNYKQNIKNMPLSSKKQWGFVAQELQEILPELIHNSRIPAEIDDSGKEVTPAMDYKSVNYIALIPILVQAVKEQQEVIDENKEAYESLKKELDMLKAENSGVGKLLNDRSPAIATNKLGQNQPNPFNKSTVIEYKLSDKTRQSFICIYNMNGRQLKKIQLENQESGSLTIQSGILEPGMYIYSLIVDNKEEDTKKMIITD
jgi:hypothetical protein